MKHFEPSQNTPSVQKDNRKKPSDPPKTFKLLLISSLLIAGIGFGMTSLWNTTFNDNVSEVNKSELVAEFAKLKSVDVELVTKEETENALASMRLSPDQRQQLITRMPLPGNTSPNAANPGEDGLKLAWVNLWDFASPDGDVVHISTAGYETDVTLQKLQTKIAVPLDDSKIVKITGVHDGGGGITLGVQNGMNPISLPVLQPGQVLQLPVAY